MRLCFVDESGGFEPYVVGTGATPLMVVAGVALNVDSIHEITHAYLSLKYRYFPGKMHNAVRSLDRVLIEIKGSEVRRSVAASSRDRRRHALGFIGGVLELLESVDARLIGRVWVKAPGQGLAPRPTYTFSAQDLATHLQHLAGEVDRSLLVFDARMANLNVEVTHSLFTQKFKSIGGDAYPSLVDVPVFGHSTSHIGIQLADIVVSAILFPMAAIAYCRSLGPSVHIDPNFERITNLYGHRIRGLQHRYQDTTGRWRGGIVVSDALGGQSGAALFQSSGRGV